MSSGSRTRNGRGRTLPHRFLLGLSAAALVAGFLTGPAAGQAAANPARNDASTGYIPDISPYAVSSVVSASGHTTVFVRGTDSRIWHRTGVPGSPWATWTPWAAIPYAYARSGPAAVSSDGDIVQVYVRSPDNTVWYASTELDETTGEPASWSSWVIEVGAMQVGRTTAAPGLAEIDPTRKAMVVRGTDGGLWYSVYDVTSAPRSWSPWVNLGGRTHAAPSIEVDFVGGQDRYVVTAMGTDGRVWRIPVNAQRNAPAAVGGWTAVPGSPRTLGPAALNTDSAAWGIPRVISSGGPGRSVLLIDAETGAADPLGGVGSSPANLAAQPDGAVAVFVRGEDGALWTNYVDPGGGVHGWVSLGGLVA
jgi:hypothetical protein